MRCYKTAVVAAAAAAVRHRVPEDNNNVGGSLNLILSSVSFSSIIRDFFKCTYSLAILSPLRPRLPVLHPL